MCATYDSPLIPRALSAAVVEEQPNLGQSDAVQPMTSDELLQARWGKRWGHAPKRNRVTDKETTDARVEVQCHVLNTRGGQQSNEKHDEFRILTALS